MSIVNWYFGWLLISLGFALGATLGLGFHRENFLGGYSSLRRRLCRLGHISMPALGIFNVLFAIATPVSEMWYAQGAVVAWIVGGVTMPLVCFLSAWRTQFRHAFFVPVTALLTAVALTLVGGPA